MRGGLCSAVVTWTWLQIPIWPNSFFFFWPSLTYTPIFKLYSIADSYRKTFISKSLAKLELEWLPELHRKLIDQWTSCWWESRLLSLPKGLRKYDRKRKPILGKYWNTITSQTELQIYMTKRLHFVYWAWHNKQTLESPQKMWLRRWNNLSLGSSSRLNGIALSTKALSLGSRYDGIWRGLPRGLYQSFTRNISQYGEPEVE